MKKLVLFLILISSLVNTIKTQTVNADEYVTAINPLPPVAVKKAETTFTFTLHSSVQTTDLTKLSLRYKYKIITPCTGKPISSSKVICPITFDEVGVYDVYYGETKQKDLKITCNDEELKLINISPIESIAPTAPIDTLDITLTFNRAPKSTDPTAPKYEEEAIRTVTTIDLLTCKTHQERNFQITCPLKVSTPTTYFIYTHNDNKKDLKVIASILLTKTEPTIISQALTTQKVILTFDNTAEDIINSILFGTTTSVCAASEDGKTLDCDVALTTTGDIPIYLGAVDSTKIIQVLSAPIDEDSFNSNISFNYLLLSLLFIIFS